ncbi:MAG: beta-lactamase family protein [Microlunatus sp.]|nr:beta-lactamase family protein [Microlunatus sp.]
MTDLNARVAATLAAYVDADAARKLGTYGLHIRLPGADPVEHRFRSDDRVNLYSVSKTFTATALLLAESEGRLGLDDLPEYRDVAADGFATVTIRQLLTMTSGTTHVWFADQPIPSLDLLRDVITAPVQPHRFEYNGSGPYVAGRILHRATGADLRAYLGPRLFEPLGIHNPAWHSCPLGFPFAESDLFTKTGELARFGALLADDGIFQDDRILPQGFLARLTESPAATDPALRPDGPLGYGVGVWLREDGSVLMLGKYGQVVIIIPQSRLVVTATAHTEAEDFLGALAELVVEPLSR